MKERNNLSSLWLRSATLFDPVQYFFNGNFWEEFLIRFGKYSVGNVVDLACGTGELRKHISSKNYLGIDLNPDFISHANKTIRLPKTKFEVGDITKNKIKDNPDTVFIISAVHHLDDEQISKLSQVIKKSKIKKFILVDGRPRIFVSILSYLDGKLGGGKYFRGLEELVSLIEPFLTIIESGEFSAKFSFYTYPYLVATAIKP